MAHLPPVPPPEDNSFDPFHAAPGRELDAHVPHQILNQPLSSTYPKYSSDPSAANVLRKHLETSKSLRITVGKTATRPSAWFARYEIDKGNPTEVLADSYPVAICRLAILRSNRV